MRAAGTDDKPGGVPTRAAGDAVPLEQDDVALARLGEVEGDACADHAAADHDDPRAFGEFRGDCVVAKCRRRDVRVQQLLCHLNPLPGFVSP